MTVHEALIVDLAGLQPQTVVRLRAAIAEAIASDVPPVQDVVAGWTLKGAGELLRRLRGENRRVQAAVITTAAAQGGFVPRNTVYELGGYQDGRSLKGFTRPVSRLMAQLAREAVISSDALSPMQPVYDASNSSFQQTSGFRMPEELIAVFAAASDTQA